MNSSTPAIRTAVSDQPFTNTEFVEFAFSANSPLNCESSSFHYYVARWYDPYLNQFIQPDTIIPDPGNSADWNRYAYVNYNPIIYIDITGHEKVIIIYGNNYSEETNAFKAAAQTAYQNALDAGYKEEDILLVNNATTDKDFYNAIYNSDVGEIEQIMFFGHGYAGFEEGGVSSFIYMSQATENLKNRPDWDPAVLSKEDLIGFWAALADRFADDASIIINACLVGTGDFPQEFANTLNTTVYAYENSMQFYQYLQTSIHTSTSGDLPISVPVPYNGSGDYIPGSYVKMVPVWGGELRLGSHSQSLPFPYFFRNPKEFLPQ